jgi:hypothetical protein
VSETLQVEEAIQLHDAPKLLVEWSPRWQDFVTSIRPAMSRSTAHLAGETPFGLRPYRNMFLVCGTELFLMFVVIVISTKLEQLRPYVAPKLASHDVIYYSGDELPRIEDLGGAQAGVSGRAGGDETHHRTQTIKIARGESLAQTVVDAPNLKLPASRDAVANLLAIRPDAGPPPVEGLRSLRAPRLSNSIVAPAPNVIRDYTRGGVSLDSVIAPAPSVTRDKALVTPVLNSAVIPPAPSVSRDHPLIAPALAPSVIAPAPDPFRAKGRVAPSLSASVIPPAPGVVSREISRSPVQMSNAAVVPPPVSAPERASARNSQLSLPSPSVIAPPPSTDLSRDMRRLPGGSIPDPSKTVVPPPPAPAGSGSVVSSLLGRIFGTTEVVPPPPTVQAGSASNGNGTSLTANVVPPPPSVIANNTSGSARGNRSGTGTALATNVVPPPPSVSGSASTGRHAGSARGSGTVTDVIPPPPSLSGTGGGLGNNSGGAGNPSGTLLTGNVVPPPPSLDGATGLSGSGRGARGPGQGSPFDAGSVQAPPTNGGSGGSSSVVISSQPGSKVGLPSSGSTGSLAMSPAGGEKPGLGGSGGGTSIGHGAEPGSGMAGAGAGAGKTGTGHGSDPSAHGGISPTPGPGGAGNATSGTPPVPGVSIQGGSSIITLPSFGSPGDNNTTHLPARSSVKEQQGPAITIVATSRSGGAFNFYGKLPGDNYTVYVSTSLGQVVMQFADPASAMHTYAGTVTGPQTLRADLPSGLPHARLVVSCTLDASGNLKNLQVLEAGPAAMTAKVMAALPSWKFRPATRGAQPIEVNAILGFGIDTNDRY